MARLSRRKSWHHEMAATYTIWLNDARGEHLAELSDRWLNLSAARVVNDVGGLTLTLPGTFDHSLIEVDRQLEIYRTPQGGSFTSSPTLLIDTIWLIRGWQPRRDGGKRVIDVFAVPLIELLTRRHASTPGGQLIPGAVYPPHPGYPSEVRLYDYTRCSAPAPYDEVFTCHVDDLMKILVSDAFGPNTGTLHLVPGSATATATTTGRDISTYLRIAPYNGACLESEYYALDKSLIDCCKELCEMSGAYSWAGAAGIPLYFDIEAVTSSQFEFRTYTYQRGVDRTVGTSSPLVVSESRGNMADASALYDYSTEVNYAYATTDNPAFRYAGEAYDLKRMLLSPFNRRETHMVMTHWILDGARFEAQALLNRTRAREKVTGVLIDSPACRFGVDWGFGDRVTVEVEDITADVMLKTVQVEASPSTEILGGTLSTRE